MLVGTYKGSPRDKKEKDPSWVAFYHARLPVDSWMLGPVSTNMYQFDQQTVS